MRRILIVALMMLLPTMSNAGLYIGWQASWGFHLNGNTSQGLLGPGGSGLSTIAQLIFSTDNVAGQVDVSNVGGGYVSGNDTVLDSVTLTEGSGGIDQWAYFSTRNYSGTFNAGYYYSRIFQDNTPANGEYYYNSPINATEDRTVPPAAAQNGELNTIFSGAGNNVNTLITPIPEPSTLALLGIGIAGMGLYRRARNRKV